MAIYICSISEFSDLPYIHLLSKKRQKQISQFVHLEDKERCLVAGLLLRYVFGEKEIGFSSFGKPYLIDNSICFNLSHSGEYVALVTDSEDVGVDIEKHSPIDDSIAYKIYTTEELNWLKAQNDKNAFYTLWTGKESIIKLTGLGLSMEPNSFSVLPLTNGLHIINGAPIYMRWYELDSYSLCVASKNKIDVKPLIINRSIIQAMFE